MSLSSPPPPRSRRPASKGRPAAAVAAIGAAAASATWLASAASCGLSASFVGTGATGGAIGVTVGSTSGTGGTAMGTGGTAIGHLAGTCVTSTDCGGDLSCATPQNQDPVLGGGAPGGFCTKPCMADSDCASLGGVCYTLAPDQPGLCTLSCTIGPAIDGVPSLFLPLDRGKCLGRSDLRCATTGAGDDAVCLPTCGSDAECGGLACDPRSAVCVAKPNTGLPFGAACDPTKSTSGCAGECIGFENGSAMCSDPCVLGGTADGGVLPNDCGGPSRGLCAFHPVTHGVGDTGYCTPACAAHSDCQNPAFWCFGVPELTPESHIGDCFAATPCPNGQGDCDGAGNGDGGILDGGDAGDAGGGGTLDGGVSVVCTPTPSGPFCLDPTFPLYGPDAGPPSADAGGADAASDAPADGSSDAGEGLDAGDAG